MSATETDAYNVSEEEEVIPSAEVPLVEHHTLEENSLPSCDTEEIDYKLPGRKCK